MPEDGKSMLRQLFFSPANASALFESLASAIDLQSPLTCCSCLMYLSQRAGPDETKYINHSHSAGITATNGNSASPMRLIVPGPFGWSRDHGTEIA